MILRIEINLDNDDFWNCDVDGVAFSSMDLTRLLAAVVGEIDGRSELAVALYDSRNQDIGKYSVLSK